MPVHAIVREVEQLPGLVRVASVAVVCAAEAMDAIGPGREELAGRMDCRFPLLLWQPALAPLAGEWLAGPQGAGVCEQTGVAIGLVPEGRFAPVLRLVSIPERRPTLTPSKEWWLTKLLGRCPCSQSVN